MNIYDENISESEIINWVKNYYNDISKNKGCRF